jgi:hypothetical protein
MVELLFYQRDLNYWTYSKEIRLVIAFWKIAFYLSNWAISWICAMVQAAQWVQNHHLIIKKVPLYASGKHEWPKHYTSCRHNLSYATMLTRKNPLKAPPIGMNQSCLLHPEWVDPILFDIMILMNSEIGNEMSIKQMKESNGKSSKCFYLKSCSAFALDLTV